MFEKFAVWTQSSVSFTFFAVKFSTSLVEVAAKFYRHLQKMPANFLENMEISGTMSGKIL